MNMNKGTSAITPSPVKSRPHDWLKRSPGATALMSKLIPDAIRGGRAPGDGVEVRDTNVFDHLMSTRAQKNLDAETIMNLSSDLKLIKQMIVSTILSPIDMVDGKLTFKTEKSEIAQAVLSQITEVVEEHFTTYYPLREQLPEILGEMLFDKGASIRIIVPEAVIDDVINLRDNYGVSMESMQAHLNTQFLDGTLKGVGILGQPGVTEEEYQAMEKSGKRKADVSRPSMENLFWVPDVSSVPTRINDAATITDNLAVLGMTTIRDRINQERISKKFRAFSPKTSFESFSEVTEHKKQVNTLAKTLYGGRKTVSGMKDIQILSTASDASRSSIGHPIVIKAPSESVFPCYPKGDEKNHLGYIVALDELGAPLNLTEELSRSIANGMVGSIGANSMNLTSSLIQQTRIATNGICMDTDSRNAEERAKIFDQVLEENILNRIKNGLVGRNVNISWNEDLSRVMLFRHFANFRTNLLFVPVEQVAYFAHEYDKNGMGKSMLDDIKQISALRAMTTFANFMAAVKNAVGRTKVTMNIDPRNPDPDKAYHVLMDEFQRQNTGGTPTDVTSSAEMFRTLRMMGVVVEVQGNPRMPNTTVDVSEFQSQKQQIDETFTQDLRRQQYMGLLVTPAMVDQTDEADFAITRWTNNQLYAKRIMMLQDITCRHSRKFVKSYTLSDGVLLSKIQAVLRDNNDKLPENYRIDEGNESTDIQYYEAIEEYFNVFRLELPRITNNQVDKQKEEYDKVKEWVDDQLENWVSPELFAPIMKDAEGNDDTAAIDMVKAHIRAYILRDYIIEQGIDFGISRFFEEITEDTPALDMVKGFAVNAANMMHNLGDFANVIPKLRQDFLDKIKINNPTQYGNITAVKNDSSAGSFDSASSNMPESGGGDFGFGDDSFGFGEDGFTDDGFGEPPTGEEVQLDNPPGESDVVEQPEDVAVNLDNPPA